MAEEKKEKITTHRVITMLERKEMEFLDKLGKDSLFTTGHKLSYNEILKGLVELAMDSGATGENVHSPEELEEMLLKKIGESLKKNA